MFYLVVLLLLLLMSLVIGIAWIALNYHIEIRIIERTCFWCGEIKEPSPDEITAIRWGEDE